jgi:hypothetical protein
MKFSNILSVVLFATVLMTLTSCTRENNDISPNDLDLDRSLEQTIIACLNGEELSSMKMPSSNDLVNIQLRLMPPRGGRVSGWRAAGHR